MTYKVKIELEFENFKPNKEEVFKYIKELHEDDSLDYQLIDNKKILQKQKNIKGEKMKKYKATIIEDITSGTLVKTKIIEAKDQEEAQEFVENEGDIDWELDYNVEFGHENEYSLEEIEEDKR